MFTKGFGLIEALLALLLSSVILISALTCQWFARRTLQVALEQMTAVHLLIDIQHSTAFPSQLAGTLVLSSQACSTCSASTLPQSRTVQLLLQQPVAAVLTDPMLCVAAGANGPRFILSWQSAVPAAAQPVTQYCGGAGRRQVALEAD